MLAQEVKMFDSNVSGGKKQLATNSKIFTT